MNTSIPFTYRSHAAGEGTRWIRLQQEDDALEAVTVAEAAQAIDNVFGLTPCHDASANDSGQGSADEEEAPPRDRFASVMAALMTTELCSQPDYWTAHVLVLRSHTQPAYVLRGEAETGPVTIAATERITRTQREEIDLSTSTSADLSWPYAGNLTTTAPATVTLTVRGSTVYASRPCGRIVVRYRTSYDRVSVRVPVEATGSQRDDGTVERPDLEAAALIAFQGSLVTALTLTPPPQDESEDQAQIDYYCAGDSTKENQTGDCWRIRRSKYLCNCSKRQAREPFETRVAAPCPSGVAIGTYIGTEEIIAGYLVCPGEEQQLNDAEFYTRTCCKPAPRELPRCKKTYGIYRGGAEIKGGADYYRSRYGANVQLTAVSPEGGVCGEEIHEWDTTPLNCCNDIIPLHPDPDNPTTFYAGEAHFIGVLDGKPGPYLRWRAYGGLYFYQNGQEVLEMVTPDRKPLVYARREGVCPQPRIRVDDGCEPLEMIFTGGGRDELVLPYDDDIIVYPEQFFSLQARGGVPPMRWQVGEGIQLIAWDQYDGRSASFRADKNFCGTAEISIIDTCQDEASATVRSTQGHWEPIHNFSPCSSPFKGKIPVLQGQSGGSVYRGEIRGRRADIVIARGSKNFNVGGQQGWPHLGSCEEVPLLSASPCNYTGVQIITVDNVTPPPCTPQNTTSGAIHYETVCKQMCMNEYIYTKFASGTGYETKNTWSVHVHYVSQLWEWRCP